MKKFILYSSLFVLPFVASYFLFYNFGSTTKGDLIRIGCLIDKTSNYRDIFKKDFKEKVYYTNISDMGGENSYDVLTIGDSFSQQKNIGYQNFLAKNEKLSVLNYNKFDNPLQVLSSILEGDVLDKINIKYILVQSVERQFIMNLNYIDDDLVLNIKDIEITKPQTEFKDNIPYFFSNRIIKFPLFNFLYNFDDNAFFSDVYKVELNSLLFSIENNKLLFYYEDLKRLNINNEIESVKQLNKKLNEFSLKLEKRNIKLIVMPAPNKYTIYHPYFKSTNKYPKSLFFNHISKFEKHYIYIDTEKVLSEAVKNQTDVYFYDDTHWSPIASKILSKEIKKVIEFNN